MERTEGTRASLINNNFYDTLGERWYVAQDDPVALLRAESRLRNPWVLETIRRHLGVTPAKVLDIGCGGGFLSNFLAQAGHHVHGVDLSEESLEVARRFDSTGRVRYEQADARALPLERASVDVACAMDFLEHVEEPAQVIAEAGRVLRPGGLFFFHTFNRNLLARFLVIHVVEWLVRNTPKHLHVNGLFIKPRELEASCRKAGLSVREWRGVRPCLANPALIRGAWSGRVPESFSFRFTRSLAVGYCGWAVKAPGP